MRLDSHAPFKAGSRQARGEQDLHTVPPREGHLRLGCVPPPRLGARIRQVRAVIFRSSSTKPCHLEQVAYEASVYDSVQSGHANLLALGLALIGAHGEVAESARARSRQTPSEHRGMCTLLTQHQSERQRLAMSYTSHLDIPYPGASSPRQALDLYLPTSSPSSANNSDDGSPSPLLVFIHGKSLSLSCCVLRQCPLTV